MALMTQVQRVHKALVGHHTNTKERELHIS